MGPGGHSKKFGAARAYTAAAPALAHACHDATSRLAEELRAPSALLEHIDLARLDERDAIDQLGDNLPRPERWRCKLTPEADQDRQALRSA
jgi:hypothetical protein